MLPKLRASLCCCLLLLACTESEQREPLDAGVGSAGTGGAQSLCAPDGNCEESLTLAAALHVNTAIDYPDKPPAGGPHRGCWTTWGVHADPVADDVWVHNLEHGGLVLLYNCADACTADVNLLEGFVATHPRTLLTPYPEMPRRFAIVSWGYRLGMDTLHEPTLQAFYDRHFNRAPEALELEGSSACQ
jgi:hypothetical protein